MISCSFDEHHLMAWNVNVSVNDRHGFTIILDWRHCIDH